MDKLIPVTSQIREAVEHAGLELDFDLPQIAVVGGQSVGKSTLLEALVGRAFLPTGSGIVTRRPLILQLVHGSDAAEWGEFGHLPGQRFDDFEEIRAEITRDTDRVCGPSKALSATPIVLKVTSPRVLTLTLVDLPGVARVPVGDQPEDIEQQIRELVLAHIASSRCLILAVAAANADLATADSLALAREVDPKGERTLGVLTKMDLVDASGADQTASVLAGKVYPLSLGFVGVICGHRGDLQDAARASEERFFGEHPAFKVVAAQCGVRYLARLLNRILLEKICEVLPGVRAQAMQMTHDVESELQGYGEPLDRQSSGEKGALLLSLFAKFAGQFGDAVEGKLSNQALEGPVGQLIGRARIDFLFRDVFARTVRDYDCFAGLSDEEIRTALRNATGPRARLFIPEVAFEILVRRQVAKLQAPSLQCAELVFDELQRVLMLSELPEFRRFVRLRENVFAVVRDILSRCLEPTLAMIRDLVAIEMAYINTNHPDFAASGALRSGGGPPGRDGATTVPKSDSKSTLAGSDPSAEAHPPGETPITSSASTGNLGTGIFSAFFRRQSSGGRLQRPTELATTPSPPSSPGPKARVVARRSMGGEVDARRAREQAFDTSSGYASRGGPKLPHVPPTICPGAQEPSEREKVEVNIVKKLMESYLTLVKKNIADSVPKAIMLFLVSGAGMSSDPGRVSSLKDAIQSECVTRLYKEELYDSLLCEEGNVKTRRDSCRVRLQGLRRVLEVTEQVRDVIDTL